MIVMVCGDHVAGNRVGGEHSAILARRFRYEARRRPIIWSAGMPIDG